MRRSSVLHVAVFAGTLAEIQRRGPQWGRGNPLGIYRSLEILLSSATHDRGSFTNSARGRVCLRGWWISVVRNCSSPGDGGVPAKHHASDETRSRCMATGEACMCPLASPPFSPVEPVVDVLHGVRIRDPSRWLEDQSAPQTHAWIDAQTHYARAYLDALPDRTKIRERVRELLDVETHDSFLKSGKRYFFRKRLPG